MQSCRVGDQVRPLGDIGPERGPRGVEGALRRQQEEIEVGDGARGVAEADPQAQRLQAVERTGIGVLADRVVDDVDALAVGELPGALHEVFRLVVDDVRAAVLLGERRLLGSADGADDRGAQVPRPLTGDEADAACRRMQQHGRALADLVVDLVRQLDQPVGGHHPLLGVAAGRPGVGTAVTDLEVRHAGPYGHDLARSFRAGHEGERHLVEPGALIDVDVVDAHTMLLEPHLAGTGRRNLHAVPLHDLGAACLVDADGVDHGCYSILVWCRIWGMGKAKR